MKKENISLEKTPEGIILQNGLVKLSLRRIKNIGYTQEYFARTSDDWRLICSAEYSGPQKLDTTLSYR